MNCWEFKKCGREPGGAKVAELGVCPASLETKLDGVHGGKNAGRACWVVAGTMSKGEIQGTFAQKHNNCFLCNFHLIIIQEETSNFQLNSTLLYKL
ncbi:MAG: two-CW domain-containing protein [Promethearchaeota archaeon]